MRTLPGTESVHGGLAPPWRTLILTSVALTLYFVAGPAPEVWVYDRSAIAAGELWRLVTGHLVHADASHALWNIAALVLLGTLFEGRLGRWLTASLSAGVLAIDLWLWWGMPALTHYCGLSGLLNTLLAAGLCALWREYRDPVVLLVAAGAVAKIAFEGLSGQAVFTDVVWPSVPSVHGVGFATGLILAALRCKTPARASPMTAPLPWSEEFCRWIGTRHLGGYPKHLCKPHPASSRHPLRLDLPPR